MKIDTDPRGNRLLARLSSTVHERLQEHWQPISLEVGKILYESRSAIQYAYFPFRGTLSAVVVMADGSIIEVATIGNEGAIGLPMSSPTLTSTNRVLVQIEGEGVRVDVSVLHKEVRQDDTVRQLFEAYQAAFLFQVSQSVACNGLHPVLQRCCRWLLMSHDRVSGGEIGLTHEFLSAMLGVRRASVTEVLQNLQEKKLIVTSRGKITIVNRAGMEALCCECYPVVRNEYDRLLN